MCVEDRLLYTFHLVTIQQTLVDIRGGMRV